MSDIKRLQFREKYCKETGKNNVFDMFNQDDEGYSDEYVEWLELQLQQATDVRASEKQCNLPVVSGSLLLDEQSLSDEIEQAHKRYGSDNTEQIDAYIEGLKDGAKYYNVSEHCR